MESTTENVLLFKEGYFEYKGWLICIRRSLSFLKNKYSIELSIPESKFTVINKLNQANKTIRITTTTKLKWIDLLGNNKRMIDECVEFTKNYIDIYRGDVDSYLKNNQ